MNKYSYKEDSTSKQVIIRAVDNATALPAETLVYNTSGLAFSYRREGGDNVAISLAALLTPAIDDPWLSGGFIHIGNGYYRLDIPNAAIITGSDSVLIHGVGTDITIIGAEIMIKSKLISDLNDLSSANITAAVPTVSAILAGLNAGTYGDGSTFAELMNYIEGLGIGNLEVTNADTATATIAWKDAAGNTIATFSQPTSGSTKGSRTLSV